MNLIKNVIFKNNNNIRLFSTNGIGILESTFNQIKKDQNINNIDMDKVFSIISSEKPIKEKKIDGFKTKMERKLENRIERKLNDENRNTDLRLNLKNEYNMREIVAYNRTESGSKYCMYIREEENMLPAVLYGKTFKERRLLKVPRNIVEREMAMQQGYFLNTLYKLYMENDLSKFTYVIPRGLLSHTFYDHIPQSVNFIKYNPNLGLKIDLPIKIIDHELSPGLSRGGFTNYVQRYVKCHVTGLNIPKSLKISIDGADIGQSVKWSSITLPDNVKLAEKRGHVGPDGDFPVVSILGSRKAKLSLQEEQKNLKLQASSASTSSFSSEDYDDDDEEEDDDDFDDI